MSKKTAAETGGFLLLFFIVDFCCLIKKLEVS